MSGLVEIDEASLPFRTGDDPPTGGQGRSHDGKMLIVGAIELGDGNRGPPLRLAEQPAIRSIAILPADTHLVTLGCVTQAHEFVFRFNRRKTRHAAFRSLFRLATNAEPLTYSMLIEPEPCA